MNTLDYVLLCIIAVAALRCFFRGIIGEVLSTAALLGGLLAGVLFYRPVGTWLGSIVALGGFSVVAGFVLSFAVVYIVVKIIERSLQSVFENLQIEALDRILGFAFGALEGLVLSSIILIVLRYQPLFKVDTLLEGSFMARILLPLIAERMPSAPNA